MQKNMQTDTSKIDHFVRYIQQSLPRSNYEDTGREYKDINLNQSPN